MGSLFKYSEQFEASLVASGRLHLIWGEADFTSSGTVENIKPQKHWYGLPISACIFFIPVPENSNPARFLKNTEIAT